MYILLNLTNLASSKSYISKYRSSSSRALDFLAYSRALPLRWTWRTSLAYSKALYLG